LQYLKKLDKSIFLNISDSVETKITQSIFIKQNKLEEENMNKITMDENHSESDIIDEHEEIANSEIELEENETKDNHSFYLYQSFNSEKLK